MREQRKTRPAGGTAGAGEAEAAAHGRAALSCKYYTTDSNSTQRIFDLLPQGESNAVASKKLAEIVGAPSVRELQNRISAEREQGNLILSTCKHGSGYYRPSLGTAGQAEIAAFIATLRSRALNTLKILKSAKAALNDSLDGQLDFLDFALQESLDD